jgi:glycosyltransferase
MSCAVVILNYNDLENTLRLYQELKDFSVLSRIYIVDNASTDSSPKALREIEDSRCKLIFAKENKGYGAGNNLGFRAAFSEGMDYCFLANPDTRFQEGYFENVLSVFEKEKQAGVVSGRMKDPYGKQVTAWPLLDFFKNLLSMGPFSKRVFSFLLFYPKAYLEQKPYVEVDVLHGSSLCISKEAFLKTRGYDEEFFLYEEEKVIGKKLKLAGYKSYLCTICSYLHEDSGSTKKSFRSLVQRQRLRQKSEALYARKYLHANFLQMLLLRLVQAVILGETLFYSFLFSK